MPDSTEATILDDLPELILVEEIFLRLPSADVLRCRAVCRSWHSATSTRKFMLDHHACQPSLPIINHLRVISKGVATSRLLAFCRDATDRTLRPVIRCATPDIHDLLLHATLDGLLLVSRTELINRHSKRLFYVCNPATRQCAPLPEIVDWWYSKIHIVGFYKHHPSGEYRVLYFIINSVDNGDRSYYVLTVGSVDDPRCIWSDWPPAPPASLQEALLDGLPCFTHNRAPPPVLQHGSLHWIVWDDQRPACDAAEIQDIVAFDTAGETFRWMRRPAQPGPWPLLFQVNGAVALCGTRDGTSHTDIEVLVMQDYEAGVWAVIHRISFPPSPSQLDDSDGSHFICWIVSLGERELLIGFPCSRLLHCHFDGGLLRDAVVLKCDDAENQDCGMVTTLHFLQESILPFPFFELQEEDGANKEHPFILGM